MGQCSTHHLLLFCQPTYRTFIKACQEVQTQMRLISCNRVYTYFRPAFACILIFGKTHFDGQLLTNSIVIVCWLKWPLVPSGDKQWQILLLTTPIRDLYVHSNTTLQAVVHWGWMFRGSCQACLHDLDLLHQPFNPAQPPPLKPIHHSLYTKNYWKNIIFWILVHERVQSPYYLMVVWS